MNNQGTSNAEPIMPFQSESNDEDLENSPTPTYHRYTLYAKIEEYQTLTQVKMKFDLSENNFLY